MDSTIEQKQPFLDINNIRRQVSDKSKTEKLYNNDVSILTFFVE